MSLTGGSIQDWMKSVLHLDHDCASRGFVSILVEESPAQPAMQSPSLMDPLCMVWIQSQQSITQRLTDVERLSRICWVSASPPSYAPASRFSRLATASLKAWSCWSAALSSMSWSRRVGADRTMLGTTMASRLSARMYLSCNDNQEKKKIILFVVLISNKLKLIHRNVIP